MNPESSLPLKLPTLIISPTDVAHLGREVEALNDWFDQAEIRKSETPVRLPRTSPLLEELAAINKLDLQTKDARIRTAQFLDTIKSKAPVVHISFAADPSAAFMAKLVTWLRQNIHPSLLVRIGLQPTIAAGCILRTDSHVYDFSLRHHLLSSKELLITALHSEQGS